MARFENKLVVVLNKRVGIGKIMNALAHVMLGFGASLVEKKEVHLGSYEDADGMIHANISKMPIIILKANSNKIRNLRKRCIAENVKYVDFTDTMSIGTFEEEYALTRTKKDEELECWAIVLYGPWEKISEWTRKFSLYQ